MSYKNNQLEISVPTWNEIFESLDGSYSISDHLGYFKYNNNNNKKTCWMVNHSNNPSLRIYVNKVKKKKESSPKLKQGIISNFLFWNNEITWKY